MYKVFLVDDEPASLELMKKIIELKCLDFEVVGTALSGKECIEVFDKFQADVLVTDIRMPEMSGIELIEEISEKYSDVIAVVVSGYQEFEYAKAVLKLNVVDYLLKPIVPTEMAEIMKKVKWYEDKLFREKREKILSAGEPDKNVNNIEKYFVYKKYDCILIRKNGLPKRFSKNEIYGNKEDVNSMIYTGRDAMETLYILPCEAMGGAEKEKILNGIQKREKVDAGYITLVMTSEGVETVKLSEVVKKLYRCMDNNLINGVNQVIFADEIREIRHWNVRKFLRNFEQFLEKCQLKQAREELMRLGVYFESIKITQIELEKIIDYIIILSKDYIDSFMWNHSSELAFEDVFLSDAGIKEVIVELATVIFSNVKEKEVEKMDTAEFFASILHYIQLHMGSNLSLKSIGHEFGISQTYLGKLFRKYKNQSFSSYLIEIRIEKAKQLLTTEEGILIKDVAQFCGYNDQFYFSRLFRSYTGISPTEYIAANFVL